jgi:hypothetical protein
VEAELGGIVVNDGSEIFAAGGVEGLDRLQDFDGEALEVLNAVEVASVRLLGSGDAFLCGGDLAVAGLDLGVGFDDFAGHEVHGFDFAHAGLPNLGAGIVAGGALAAAQVAQLPPGDGIEVKTVTAIGDLATGSRAEAAVTDAQ